MASMRGQTALEAMRRAGLVPESVDICLFPVKRHLLGAWPYGATLQADAAPNPAALRCIVGLSVRVAGSDARRVAAMRDACIKAGASRVIATVFDGREDGPDYSRFEAVSVTDTEGVLTWPN